MRIRAVIAALIWGGAASSAQADSAIFRFSWEGANGYAMSGAMALPAEALDRWIVTERDVVCFVIAGSLDEAPIGDWRLTQLGPDTSWRLHFDPRREAFLVEGDGVRMPQAWNMNGAGNDCGEDGFGFNLGNLGQDICLDNRLVEASRVAPPTPFPAVRDDGYLFPPGSCAAPPLLSLRPARRDPAS